MTSLLTADRLTFNYDSKTLFKDLSFTIAPNERVALTAPSGAGKSTLALILSGHLSPKSGKVMLWDKEITNAPNRNVILVHQEDDLFPWLKVKEQLLFANPNCDYKKILTFLKLIDDINHKLGFPST